MKPIYETDSERMEAKREAARDWKERNKNRRTKAGYVGKGESSPKQNYDQTKREQMEQDAWWAALKKKHAGKPRLEKSIKPPIILGPDKGIGR